MFDVVARNCDNVDAKRLVVKTMNLCVKIDKSFVPCDFCGSYRFKRVSVRISRARLDLDKANVAVRRGRDKVNLDTDRLFCIPCF